MKRAARMMIVGAFFCMSARAQSQSGAQAGAQTSGQANVEAGQTQAQTSTSASSAASVQNGPGGISLASGTAFNAELSSSIDSKKCKPGDTVNARVTEAVKSEGKTAIPKGAKLVGQVTQASARSKGEAESALGIAFDKVILKNGQEIPLNNVAIQAIASAQSNASAADGGMDAMAGVGTSTAGSGAAGGRGALGGVTSTAGATVGTVTNTAANVGAVTNGPANSTANAAGSLAAASKGAVGGLNAAGQFTSNSQGVFGLNGLSLRSAASSATQGSVITSSGKNVQLESGTRMLLVSKAGSGGEGTSKPSEAGKPQPKADPKPQSNKPERP